MAFRKQSGTPSGNLPGDGIREKGGESPGCIGKQARPLSPTSEWGIDRKTWHQSGQAFTSSTHALSRKCYAESRIEIKTAIK
jgi:hypothetical protein